MGAQLQVAERVQTIVRQRTVRVDAAAKQQADLVGHQPPDVARSLLAWQGLELGAELAGVLLAPAHRLEALGELAALREGRQPRRTDQRRVAAVDLPNRRFRLSTPYDMHHSAKTQA